MQLLVDSKRVSTRAPTCRQGPDTCSDIRCTIGQALHDHVGYVLDATLPLGPQYAPTDAVTDTH